MNREVTKTGPGVFLIPKASPELRALLDRRAVVPDYGGDDGQEGGGDFQRGYWVAPEWVDIRERDEAALRLHELKRGLEPEAEPWIVDFLNVIWVGTKHAADQRFEAVAMVYPRLLRQFPRVCWTEAMLDKAVLEFKTFFPSAGELAEFFLRERKRLEEEITAHEGIIKAPTKKPEPRTSGSTRPWAQGGAEDHAAWLADRDDRARRELAAIVAERYGPPPSIPPRLPGESDNDYVDRLGDIRRAEADRATRAMKRFNPPKSAQPVERMEMAYEALRKAAAEKPGKADKSDYQPPGEDSMVCHGERLAGMTPDLTTEEEP